LYSGELKKDGNLQISSRSVAEHTNKENGQRTCMLIEYDGGRTDKQPSNQANKQASKQASTICILELRRSLHNNLVEQCQPATNQHAILQNIPG